MEKETITNYVFQSDSECVRKFRKTSGNYSIEIDESAPQKDLCVVYFSSNAIYYPNNEDSFTRSIVEKDYYEWRNAVPIKAHKQIFVRDVYKQWYLQGINDVINTPPELLKFLKQNTTGYRVIMVGSSAGGYAAILYGCLLNAEKVFAFNAQFELSSLLPKGELINPILIRKKDDPVVKRFYDIVPYLNAVPIYYFMSDKSDWDNSQRIHLHNRHSVRVIRFSTAHHGVPFPKVAIPYVMQTSSKHLDSLSGKRYNPIMFSIKFAGLFKTMTGITTQYIGTVKKKFRNR